MLFCLLHFCVSCANEPHMIPLSDAEIQCDVEGPVEVHAGENVTIQCDVLPKAQYRWTKVKRHNLGKKTPKKLTH